ncbi:MAG: DUF3050 domain-containing protein [Acidobacteriota bacterium]
MTVHADSALDSLRGTLRRHRLHELITSEDRLRAFMRTHVFCVWDFQSLLKSLQRRLSCVEIPWVPTGDPESRYLINDIVLEEESDRDETTGRCFSHVELYLEAMDACDADRGPLLGLIEAVRSGQPVRDALAAPNVPEAARNFVTSTFDVIETGDTHEIGAAFAYGREDVLPVLFGRFVAHLAKGTPERWGPFRYYLERHVERDGDRHGPASLELVDRLCGGDETREKEVVVAAQRALEARLVLWDALAEELSSLD